MVKPISKPFERINFLKNMKLRTKLLLSFIFILAINVAAGSLNLGVIRELGELVNVTYDKALMSGSFSQAAKYDFAKYDQEIRSALVAESIEGFNERLSAANEISSTLSDDLGVVEERALSEKSGEFVGQIKGYFKEIQEHKKALIDERKASKTWTPQERLAALAKWSSDETRIHLEEKLTSLSDDAAEVGYRFRLSSEEKNKQNVKATTWLLGVSFGLSVLIALGLAWSILSPLRLLIAVCEKVGAGDYSKRVELTSKDEWGALATSFNSMLNTIQAKDENMGSLLSALPFGLFYFDRTGEISKERSSATDELFPAFSEHAKLHSFMASYKGLSHELTKDTIDIIFDEMLPFSSAAGMFPSKLSIGQDKATRQLELSFKDQRTKDGKIDRVIVLAEDVTEKVRAKRQSEYQMERVRRISAVSADHGGYKDFLPETNEKFASAIAIVSDYHPSRLEALKRDLHSIKGLLGVYEFNSCAGVIHDLESQICERDAAEFLSDIVAKLQATKTEFERQATDVGEILGFNKDENMRNYSKEKIEAIRLAAAERNYLDILGMLNALDRFPVAKTMSKYVSYCEKLAERIGDKAVKVQFDEKDTEVAYEEVQHLDHVFVHILRNCLDHGIETKEERMEKGKAEHGTLMIGCQRLSDHGLEIVLRDDGQGINAERLLQKAVSSGVWTAEKAKFASDQEKLELIFASGLSTKEEVTDVSGRGVGMDAVRDYLRSIGGSISVKSEMGKGTEFVLRVPPFERIRRSEGSSPAAAAA